MLFNNHLIFRRRVFVVTYTLLIIFSIIMLLIMATQINQNTYYNNLSYKNRTRIKTIIPARGNIVDRNNTILAKNNTSYRVVFNSSKTSKENVFEYLNNKNIFSNISLEKFYTRHAYGNWHVIQNRLNSYDLSQLVENNDLLEGVTIHACLDREYTQGDLFAHTLGYVNSNTNNNIHSNNICPSWNGISGLELYHDDTLKGTIGKKTQQYNAFGKLISD